ncbi:MAG: acyl-CoA dehydrogenase [Rhodospirillaceae bacterium]|nr:acyl-CoA dehydrogenase [Rhodospirillaceae bacterium]|tara:strand:+ start:182 stop:1246 length:1065 start_codon:yes stop_codon:yes gene_type:complete
MSDDYQLLIDATTRIFEDLCDPQKVNSAHNGSWRRGLWQALEESGLTLAWVPERYGGSGGTLANGFDIIEVTGQFAAPIALPETLLAGWLLSKARIPCPTGMLTVAPFRPRDKITINSDNMLMGKVRGIAFAGDVENIAVLAYRNEMPYIGLVEANSCTITPNSGLSGDGRDVVNFDNVDASELKEVRDGFGRQELLLMGATIRSIQIGGALQAILRLATEYAKERVAFEKPISKFQVIQHNLAKLANETAAAVAVARSSADTINTNLENSDAVFLEAASAKIRTGEAAGEGAAIAHQVYGAIGFTEEHILHRFTQRLWDWRDDFGNESEWAVQLGELIATRGADELWPLLTSR